MAERIGLVLYCTPDLAVDASEVFDECCKINNLDKHMRGLKMDVESLKMYFMGDLICLPVTSCLIAMLYTRT